MKIKRKTGYIGILLLSIPLLTIIYTGFWGAYQFVSPAPSREMTISAGNIHGAYYSYAEKYKEDLALDGIELSILESKGSRENIQRLLNRSVDVALVQGGTAYADEQLVSLGSLYYEPVTIFYKKDLQLSRLNDFSGLKISIGVQGSGRHMLANQLFAINHVNSTNTRFLYFNPQESVEQLKAGKIDAVFFVSDISSPVIRVLLEDQNFSLFDFQRAEAYSQVLPFLSKVTLHEGIVDFKNNIPNQAISLIAPTANLVVHEDINKSLAILLLQSMEKNHSNNSLFSKQGFFPTEHLTAFPISDVAKRFLEFGPPFLMKYLPFWVATFIDRMIVLLLPLLLLILPLFKILPPLYRWRIRSKVYRWYEQLQKVDDQTHVTYLSEKDYENLNEEIYRLSEEVSRLNTPLSNTDQIYNLLVHIDLVRKIIQEKKCPSEADKK